MAMIAAAQSLLHRALACPLRQQQRLPRWLQSQSRLQMHQLHRRPAGHRPRRLSPLLMWLAYMASAVESTGLARPRAVPDWSAGFKIHTTRSAWRILPRSWHLAMFRGTVNVAGKATKA